MRSRAARLVPALVAALLASCGGDDATSPRSYVGTYTLSTLNGSPPPVTVYDTGTERIVVQSGRIVLSPSKAVTVEFTVLVGAQGLPAFPQTATCSGTYQVSAPAITLDLQPGAFCPSGSYRGTLTGNTLTLTLDQFTAVYRK